MKKLKRFNVYLLSIVLVIVDQISKLAVISNIKNDSITIIKGILKFTYCENKGVAFSLGNGHVAVFIIVNVLIICGLWFYYENNRTKFKWIISKIFFIMVIAGGVSNLLDRIFRGYVVDFIDISELFSFAIFNISDIFIVVGIIGLVVYMIYETGGRDNGK